MGNLLRLLSRDADSCCSLPKTGDVFVDFENAKATQEESGLYDEAEQILQKANSVFKDLTEYKGASKEIREAIGHPSAESESKAWSAVLPLVLRLKSFYQFSLQLDSIIPKILIGLCSQNPDQSDAEVTKFNILEQLDDHQALVKQFAKFLDFALKFDECKMTTPSVQNDLSFYRRTTQRSRKVGEAFNPNLDELNEAISPDLANEMSLFFAHATPMMNKLSLVTSKFVNGSAQNVASNTTEMLSVIAKVCQKMLDTPELKSRLQFQSTELFILRVMVAAIILYDHVHKTGAFAKGSSVDVKGCVRVLKDQDKNIAESLLNGLRYTTKHLNDDSTPKSLKTLLFEEFI